MRTATVPTVTSSSDFDDGFDKDPFFDDFDFGAFDEDIPYVQVPHSDKAGQDCG